MGTTPETTEQRLTRLEQALAELGLSLFAIDVTNGVLARKGKPALAELCAEYVAAREGGKP